MRLVRILAMIALATSALAAASGTLDMYILDVVGKSSLFISPSGETMLIDAGVPASAGRIVEACKVLGVKKIDSLASKLAFRPKSRY